MKVIDGKDGGPLKTDQAFHSYGKYVTNTWNKSDNQSLTGSFSPNYKDLEIVQYLAILYQPSANGEISN